MAPNPAVEAPRSSPLGCTLFSSMSVLSTLPCSGIPGDFALFDVCERPPSASVFFLFLVAVVVMLDDAGGRIVGSDEGGVLLSVIFGRSVSRLVGSKSMLVALTADARP